MKEMMNVDPIPARLTGLRLRWKRTLESGEFATIAEMAEHEHIAYSHMTRLLRLTLLAPDLVEAILDGLQRSELTLPRLLEPFPAEWGAQRRHCSSRP